MQEWINVKDELPNKKDGWIGYVLQSDGDKYYYIRVLAFETGGYGSRIRIREFKVELDGKWTGHNKDIEIISGSFGKESYDWIITHWMPLPAYPVIRIL